MARVQIKLGDIFFAELDKGSKKYFQFIASDLTQLNSDVIRVFKKQYAIDDKPKLSEVVQGEVEFYAHCVTKLGVKLGYWKKVGNIKDIGNTDDILFRNTNDYGSKPGEQVEISQNWYVWKLNDEEFTHVGKLTGKNRKAEIGIVISPDSIVYRMRTGEYDFMYPTFE